MKPVGIVVHHSLTPDGKTVDWDAIKQYHIKHQGWADIGYHVGVERINGVLTTLTGRPLDEMGAHTLGKNNTIGICIVGNFDLAPPDDELFYYSAIVVSQYLRMFNLNTDVLWTHHQFANYKTCPGSKFPWEQFKQKVKELL